MLSNIYLKETEVLRIHPPQGFVPVTFVPEFGYL